jgi:hypothetical protein
MRRLRVVATLCLTLAAACGGSKTPQASDYDRSCATVADCALVFVGDPGCCGGGCPNTAVRMSEVARVKRDVQAAKTCAGIVDCAPSPGCADGRAQCIAATCQLTLPSDGGP